MRITRKFEFDAGHRVLGHKGKCASLHGHRYVALVTVGAAYLDELGMVIDFSVIKEKVGKWIDDNWDHNMILHQDDPLFANHTIAGGLSPVKDVFAGKKPYVMPNLANPTAEFLAQELFIQSQGLLLTGLGIKVRKVRIYETPNCYADCVLEDLEI